MKQFDLQGNEYDCTIEIPLKKATYEDIQALNINLQTQLFVKDKEIERLNNIINELEKYLIDEIEDYDKNINSRYVTDITREQYEGEKVCFEDTLGKLQELKGSDKECM